MMRAGGTCGDSGEITLVKIGGNVVDDEALLGNFLTAFAALPGRKALVHGGGVMASQLQRRLGVEPRMVEGRRVTDAESLRMVAMVYVGWCNKHIVAGLQARGCNALGLSGCDGGVICARRRPPVEMPGVGTVDFGFVGDIAPDGVDAAALVEWMARGLVPVVSPITHDGAGGLLNTNADTVASSVAVALAHGGARVSLVYCFEKDGVLYDAADNASLIPQLDPQRYGQLKAEGRVSSGMIPKLDNAFAALRSGVAKVTIGHADHLSDGRGTVLTL